MKVKIFHCNSPLRRKQKMKSPNTNRDQFENQINAWLEQHPDIQIARVEQSSSGGSFFESLWLISIWYE